MSKIPRRVRNLTGQTFGRLTAISRYDQPGISVWKCQCSCGGTKDVAADHLQRSITQSCGCLRLGFIDVRAATDTAFDRTAVLSHVQRNPGGTCQEIAGLMQRAKTSIYEHLCILEGEGKIVKKTTYKGESKVRCMGYYINKLEFNTRCDYPSQVTVAAVDKAADVPAMDYLTAHLFGRIKETA